MFLSIKSRYISSVLHLLERQEGGQVVYINTIYYKNELEKLDGYAVHLFCYFPLALIVVLNSLKTKGKCLHLTTELTA